MKPPANHKIQMLVFGQIRGYGESILIHLGDNVWIIIDSCINEKSEPAAISYLNSIDVDVSKAVHLVVATHWHDDHINGLSDILSECSSAKFVMPQVFNQEEFVQFQHVCGNSSIFPTLKPKNSEIIKCFGHLNKSNLKLATENKSLLKKGDDFFSHRNPVDVISLSPSEFLFNDFLLKIGEYLKPDIADSERILLKKEISGRENELSVAIQVNIGKFSILLGSDVLKGNSKFGWKSIISNSKDWITKSKIYKVAHHGSLGADCDEIWTELLYSKPYTVVTPWTKGGRFNPTHKKIIELKRKSSEAYITSKIFLEEITTNVNNNIYIPDINKLNKCGIVCLDYNILNKSITGNVYNGASKL